MFYLPNKAAAGNGVQDFYGSTYTIHTDGSLRRLTKNKHETRLT